MPHARKGRAAALTFGGVFTRLDGKQLDSLRVLLMSIADALAKEIEEREERRKLDP